MKKTIKKIKKKTIKKTKKKTRKKTRKKTMKKTMNPVFSKSSVLCTFTEYTHGQKYIFFQYREFQNT